MKIGSKIFVDMLKFCGIFIIVLFAIPFFVGMFML